MGEDNSTYKKFLEFHEAHPEVWEYFVRFSVIAISKGHTRFSSRMVIERVRWETMVGETPIVRDPRHLSVFKINNNFSPYYARLFAETHNMPDFFETRKLKSEKGIANETKDNQSRNQQEST